VKKLLSYLKYLSPVLISKHSYDFDYKAFLNTLRLNTQSPYGDEKTLLRDKKMGRTNNKDTLTLYEYDQFLFIKDLNKEGILNYACPTTLICIKSENKINFPGFIGSIYSLLEIFLIFVTTIYSNDNILYPLLAIALFIGFNIQFQDDYLAQNELVEETINKMNKQNENFLPLNPPPKGEA